MNHSPGLLAGEEGIRNGADVLLKSLFIVLGAASDSPCSQSCCSVRGCSWWYETGGKSGAPRGAYFVGMLAESVCYAMVFGIVTSTLTGLLLHGPAALSIGQGPDISLATRLMVSLGAGHLRGIAVPGGDRVGAGQAGVRRVRLAAVGGWFFATPGRGPSFSALSIISGRWGTALR